MARIQLYAVLALLTLGTSASTALAAVSTEATTGLSQFPRSLTRAAGLTIAPQTTQPATTPATIHPIAPPIMVSATRPVDFFTNLHLLLLGLVLAIISGGLLYRFIRTEHRLTTETQKFG